ncbi:YD repeat-containing protein [Sphingobium sp. AEW010]|nr:hypothetical protein [Sphingobium sp. JAI105]TWC98172.1 YD repeat-containing protein [Sphingobium sp. AEW010]TWD18234.1 YD repeat-containing protein [Sphingobium sp. AEW013]TWD20776.1 YD repeat-containing protein [Sphingobium sp. AEW001]
MMIAKALAALTGYALIIALPYASYAQETTAYSYDALGRMTNVSQAGGPNNGVSSTYAYDSAGNRTSVTVSGVTTGALSSSSPNNTCTLNANGVCNLTISWNVAGGPPSNVVVKVGNPETVFASGGTSGSASAPWIQASGHTFKLYGDSKLLSTLNVHGVAAAGSLSSSSPTNTCTLNTSGVCTLRIYWNITSGSPANIVVKVGSPQVTFASGGLTGYSDAPWIQATGSTFYLYADSILLASLYVHGTP